MEILFIRHGKPNYSLADERRFSYAEKNYSPLDVSAFDQVEAAALDPRLTNADIILSSPFTRALQTAEIINRHLQKKLIVEYDLHEWAVSLDGSVYIDEMETLRRYMEFSENNGKIPADKKPLYESAESIKKRGKAVLMKYTHLKKVIVVAHGAFIKYLTGIPEDVLLCGIVEYEFLKDYSTTKE